MVGQYCCVKSCHSRSHDRPGIKRDSGLRFFSFPTWKQNEGPQIEGISKRRRIAWVAAVRRKDLTFNKIPGHMRVCSLHFHSGQPSYEMQETHPDWTPSLLLGHNEVKVNNKDRFARQLKRNKSQKERADKLGKESVVYREERCTQEERGLPQHQVGDGALQMEERSHQGQDDSVKEEASAVADPDDHCEEDCEKCPDRFPRDSELRRNWELALRREDFAANDGSVICSQHFKPDEFDRTGQICRIKPGVIPSVFNFPARRGKPEERRTTTSSKQAKESVPLRTEKEPQPNVDLPEAERTTASSKQAKESLPLHTSQYVSKEEPQPNDDHDHNYSLPSSPSALKARLSKAADRVLSLEKEKRNAQVRERRAKSTLKALLKVLREKNLLSKALYKKLERYPDLPLDFSKKRQNVKRHQVPVCHQACQEHGHLDADDS